MMKKLRYLFSTFLLLLVAGVTWAAEETVTFSSQGYTNGQAIETYTGTNFSIAFDKGSNNNAPKYYTSGTAIRAYGGNYFTVTSTNNITKIVITFGSSDGSNTITTDVETYDKGTWTGSAKSVKFTIGGTTGHRRIASIAVTTESANPDVVGKPIFTVNGTTYAGSTGNNYVYDGDQLVITCDNADKIYYTTNGNSPFLDASGNPNEYTFEYTSPITISSTQTVFNAIGRKNSGTTGEVAGVVFLIKEPVVTTGSGTAENPYTVADALALLADGQTPTGVYVKGIVSHVDEVSTQYGNATYWISDDGTTDNQMEAYRGKYLEKANFTSEDQIQVGDEVVVTGNIVLYGNDKNPEFSQGNYLYSLTRNTPEVAKYYLMGIDGDWTTGIEFTYDASSKTYTLPDQAIAAASEVKIKDGEGNLYSSAADGNQYWITADNHTNLQMVTDYPNTNYYFQDAGTYTFTISFTEEGAPLLTVTGWPAPTYYLVGSFDEWGAGVEFTDNGDGTFTATQAVENGTEFKVKVNNTRFGASPNGSNVVNEANSTDIMLDASGNNFSIEISEPTTLTFTLTVSDTAAPTLTVTGWPQAPVEGAEKYVLVTDASELADGDEIIFVAVGSATVSGSSVNFTKAMADANTEKHIFNVTDVTVNEDNTVTINDNVSKWILGSVEGTTTANWTFKNGNNYLAATGTDKNNYLETIEEVNANSIATIKFKNNVASVIFTSDNRNVLSYNNNSDTGDNTKARFSCYAGVQNQSLYIYKKQLLTTIDVTIGETGYATLYYSDMNLVVPEGVVAKTYTVNDGLKESTTYVATNVIPAGTGVVLEGAQGTYTFNVTLDNGKGDPDNMLKGTDAATTISEKGYKYYILSKSKDGQKIGFYYQNEDGSDVNNGAHKAYLPVPQAAAGGAKGWSFDGEATGIRSIEAGAGVENAVIYNLSGVRMNSQNLPKGIYIVNGKKMVVK